MRNGIWVLLILVSLIFTTAAAAQDIDITKLPGYIDLDDIKIPEKAGRVTEIDLGPGLLSLLSAFSDDEDMDDDLKDNLPGLLSIRLKSFDIELEELSRFRSLITKYEKKLEKNKWQRLVRTRNEDDMSIISIKVEGKKTVGLFIMSLEAGESITFANMVGHVNLNQLTSMGLGLSDSTMKVIEKSLGK